MVLITTLDENIILLCGLLFYVIIKYYNKQFIVWKNVYTNKLTVKTFIQVIIRSKQFLGTQYFIFANNSDEYSGSGILLRLHIKYY